MAVVIQCKAILEKRLLYSVKAVHARYLELHYSQIINLLDLNEARTSRLDTNAFREHIQELAESWQENMTRACYVVCKDKSQEMSLATAITKKKSNSDKTPILLLQLQDADIQERAT